MIRKETNRDMEEIKEIMECDADIETKCKMISDILTAKPHYFEKQKPCEDAVSRQAVLDKIQSNWWSARAIEDAIKNLQSVIPTRKKGKWILLDECANSGYYCSKCNKKVVKEGWSDTVKKIKYCPNCGAEMENENGSN